MIFGLMYCLFGGNIYYPSKSGFGQISDFISYARSDIFNFLRASVSSQVEGVVRS